MVLKDCKLSEVGGKFGGFHADIANAAQMADDKIGR